MISYLQLVSSNDALLAARRGGLAHPRPDLNWTLCTLVGSGPGLCHDQWSCCCCCHPSMNPADAAASLHP